MLKRYLYRLYDTILSRRYIDIEHFELTELPDKRSKVEGQLKFPNASLLDFYEVISVHNKQIVKTRYAYHYQDASGQLIFRYDNAPHHPHVSTFPHHKHSGSVVESVQIPDFGDVLTEIEEYIYTRG